MVLKFAFTSLQGLEGRLLLSLVCYIYAVMLFVSNYVLNLLTNLLIDHIYQAKWPFMEKYRLDKVNPTKTKETLAMGEGSKSLGAKKISCD